MAFRNPLYLDLQLLQNLADYHGVAMPADAQVTRRVLEERTGHAGVDKVLQLGGEKGSSEEVTEVYQTSMRPVRAMNDVVDALLEASSLVDLATDPEATFAQRDVVQVEGSVSLSPVTEIGALMGTLLPLFLDQLAAGGNLENVDPSVLGKAFLSQGSGVADVPHVFEVDVVPPLPAVVFIASPSHLFGSTTIDDLEGDFTLMATVDRLIRPGTDYSLERHLLPGIGRTARRALSGKGLAGLLESFGGLLGKPIEATALSIAGPAVLLTPIAIY